MANPGTETKAQRVERLKREKNPWEGLDEIRRFARDVLPALKAHRVDRVPAVDEIEA